MSEIQEIAGLKIKDSYARSEIEGLKNKLEQVKETRFYKNLKHLIYPSDFKGFASSVSILNHDNKYYGDISEFDSFKNVSTNTWYLSPDGNDSNEGKTKNTPKASLSLLTGSSEFNGGDTIILLPGIYLKSKLGYQINARCNIIAEKPNTVYLTECFDDINSDPVKTTGYNYVYEYQTSGCIACFDLRNKDYPIQLKKVESISECEATENSYYFYNASSASDRKLYVHMLNGYTPSRKNFAFSGNYNTPLLEIPQNISKKIVYMENINLIGGTGGNFYIHKSTGNRHEAYMKNCRFLYALNNTNGFKSSYGQSILLNCESLYNTADGFGYHEAATGVEINCIASNNGHVDSYNSNGSTSHNNCKMLRVNGVYSNNVGPNVADVLENCVSLNVNCKVFDSIQGGDSTTNNCDFNCQRGAKMWIIGCHVKGSNSISNITNSGDTLGNIYVADTEYDTSDGDIVSYTSTFVESKNNFGTASL